MKINILESYKRIRKVFQRNPGTKIHKDKRKKTRQQEKINIKKELND